MALCGSEEDDYNSFLQNQHRREYEKHMTPPKLYRYYIPSKDGLSGWGEIVLSSGGFFAAVTDYGNYAFAWRHFGEGDFRKWFADLENSTDYLLNKISNYEFDLESTCNEIKREIFSSRRKELFTEEEAREEYDLVLQLALGEISFDEWSGRTSFCDAFDFKQDKHPADAVAFAEDLLPRLAKEIRDELSKEAQKEPS